MELKRVESANHINDDQQTAERVQLEDYMTDRMSNMQYTLLSSIRHRPQIYLHFLQMEAHFEMKLTFGFVVFCLHPFAQFHSHLEDAEFEGTLGCDFWWRSNVLGQWSEMFANAQKMHIFPEVCVYLLNSVRLMRFISFYLPPNLCHWSFSTLFHNRCSAGWCSIEMTT